MAVRYGILRLLPRLRWKGRRTGERYEAGGYQCSVKVEKPRKWCKVKKNCERERRTNNRRLGREERRRKGWETSGTTILARQNQISEELKIPKAILRTYHRSRLQPQSSSSSSPSLSRPPRFYPPVFRPFRGTKKRQIEECRVHRIFLYTLLLKYSRIPPMLFSYFSDTVFPIVYGTIPSQTWKRPVGTLRNRWRRSKKCTYHFPLSFRSVHLSPYFCPCASPGKVFQTLKMHDIPTMLRGDIRWIDIHAHAASLYITLSRLWELWTIRIFFYKICVWKKYVTGPKLHCHCIFINFDLFY